MTEMNPSAFLGKAERQMINRRAHQLATQATHQLFENYRLRMMQAAAEQKRATGCPVTDPVLDRLEPPLAEVLHAVAAGGGQ